MTRRKPRYHSSGIDLVVDDRQLSGMTVSDAPQPDPFGRFVKIVGGDQVLDSVRAISGWHLNAPSPLFVLGSNGSGKTTFLRLLADEAHKAAPQKRIAWLGDIVFSMPTLSDGPASVESTAEKTVRYLDTEDAALADMLIIDDAFSMLDSQMRRRFIQKLSTFVKKGVPIVVALSGEDALSSITVDAEDVLLEHASVVTLNPMRPTPGWIAETEEFAQQTAVAELMALETAALPQQASITTHFEQSGPGPIKAAREPAPVLTHEKLELYDELRTKVAATLDLCAAGSNRTALFRSLISSLFELLPPDLSEVQPRRLWSRANTVRRYRDADLRMRRAQDPDELPLPELPAEMLSDLVEQFNVFAMHDDNLRRLDEQSLGPIDRAELLIEVEAGRSLISALSQSPLVADSSAVAALEEAASTAEEASAQTGINADQALSNALTIQRNGVIAVLAKAVSEVKTRLKTIEEGAWRAVGGEAVKLIFAAFVKAYEKPIATLLTRIQGADIAAYVLKLLRQLLGG